MSTDIRRISKQVRQWTDKSVPRHKHMFTEDAFVQQDYRGSIIYYSVDKCKFCCSFRNAEVVDNIDDTKPVIKLIARHCFIGFRGCYLSDIQ